MAANFSSAVPLPPATIAPAWPMRRPGGAVRPAMKPTTGRSKLALTQAAASSSALPPISPIMITASVSRSALKARLHLEHVVHRDALGDAHDELDAGVGGFHDRVGRERRRHEDHRRVGARLGARLGDAVEHRNAFHHLAALARRHPAHDLGAVVAAAEGVELALFAGDALDDETGVVVDPDRHLYIPPRAAATAFSAAEAMSSATMNLKLALRRISRPCSTLVPSRRTMTGSLTLPSSSIAPTTPLAILSVRAMPPKMLIITALVLASETRMRKAFFTASWLAEPPTSRKFAGSPP